MSRILNSMRNIKYAICGQATGIIVSFFNRMVFVRMLSAEYLGLNGLFINILSILSFAELGIGSAITYSMYKPLSERDEPKLKALMGLYKLTYIIIGVIISLLGLILTPFLGVFINDMPDITYIKYIYLIYVANTAVSYFFSYKRSYVIADQKKYIDTVYRYGFYFVLNIMQILILLITRSFIFYISLQLLTTVVENILISRKVDRLYPFLIERNYEQLEKKEKEIIVKNVKAMILHKIGSVVVMGTDNLLISKFISIVSVGIYSNYLLIINALNTVFGLIFQAVTASVGNLGATETKEKSKFIFNSIDFVGFWLYAFASISLVNLFNPFIKLWVGSSYTFPLPVVLIIILNFYLSGRRKSVITFRDALGVFWHDRYKAIFEAGVKIAVSLILVNKIGISGIFIGTTISTITTCFWIEPYVLYKHGFHSSPKLYFIKYISDTVLMIIAGYITWKVTSTISDVGVLSFIYKMLVCLIVPNLLFLIIFWKNNEFKYLLSILKISMRHSLQSTGIPK